MEEASNAAQIELTEEQLEKVDRFRRSKETSVLVVMFTDMRGSTEIAERRGEQYAQQMRENHNRMLVKIIEREERGLCVKTIGDSLMSIFAEPSVAVERALEIQERLHHYNQEHPEEEAIVVRIGMHMGQVSIEDQTQMDVFGRHVNWAARVESLADGGHIYLTHAVYDSAHGWLREEGLDWRDHGPYQVKGIAEPLRIYEVFEMNVTQPKKPDAKRYIPLRYKLTLPLAVALGILSVIFVISLLTGTRDASLLFEKPISEGQQTLAVAYFDNITGNEEYDWLRKGLTAMLITDLSKASQLRVVPRERMQTLVESMEKEVIGRDVVQEAGRSLGVSYLLVGSYIITKPQIRLDAQLVDVATNTIINAEKITGDISKLQSLEKELVSAITENMGIALSSEEETAISQSPTESLDATMFYSRGLDYMDKGMYAKAIEAFEGAIAADPRFVTPHISILVVYCHQISSDSRNRLNKQIFRDLAIRLSRIRERYVMLLSHCDKRIFANAELSMLETTIQWYEKILTTDPDNLDKHVALGILYFTRAALGLQELSAKSDQADIEFTNRLKKQSIKHLKHALKLNPPRFTSAILHQALGWNYVLFDSPLTPLITPKSKASFLTLVRYYCSFMRIMREYRKACQLAPDVGMFHMTLGDAYLFLGKEKKALSEYKRALEWDSDRSCFSLVWMFHNPGRELFMSNTFVDEAQDLLLAGKKGQADTLLTAAKGLTNEDIVNHRMWKFYLDHGDSQQALDSLRQHNMVADMKKLSSPPVIDGILDDTCWEEASVLSDFVRMSYSLETEKADLKSEVLLGYTDEAIYIGAIIFEESTRSLVANRIRRDSAVYFDDSVEVFFDTNRDYRHYYQFCVNSLGTVADFYNDRFRRLRPGLDWDGFYELSTHVADRCWAAEMKIPFETFDNVVVEEGAMWGFNFCRTKYSTDNQKPEYTQWVPTYWGYQQPVQFGVIVFE